MSAVNTSREAVERLCERMLDDCNSPDAARYQPYTDGRMRDTAATLRALLSERDAAEARARAAERERDAAISRGDDWCDQAQAMRRQRDAALAAVEAAARAIVGPWLPVPDGCQFTLDQLRDVRWRRSSPPEQGMARTQAASVLRTLVPLLPALGYRRVGADEVVVPREPTEAWWNSLAVRLDAHPQSLHMDRLRRAWPDLMLAAAPDPQREGGA